MDPLRIVERNEHLVLHSRFDNYRPAMLTEISDVNRQMIEVYFNALSLVPTEEYRFHKYRHREIGKTLNYRYDEIKNEVRLVKKEIRAKGALPSNYFESRDWVSWGYGHHVKKTSVALNYMWYRGELMTARRENGKRILDFPERVIPPGIEMRLPSQSAFRNFMLEKHMRTYALADLRFYRFGNLEIKVPERKKLVQPFIKKGQVIPIEVENSKGNYLISKDNLEFLLTADSIKPDNRVRFLAPLDNMTFNRDTISDIFGFDYRWEVYVPKAKRKFGYYVMPILYQTDFIGRIDPKLDREKKRLEFMLIQIEDSVKISDTLVKQIAAAARRMANFCGVPDIVIHKTQPSNLKASLTKAL